MNHFKLTEYTSPAEIFQYQENLRANRLWGRKKEQTPIPKIKTSKVVGGKKPWGLLMAIRQSMSELRP